MRTHKRLVSVTADSEFAYVECGCGHVTIKREGNRIVLVAGPGCQLAVSGGPDIVTVAVSSKKDEKHLPSMVSNFLRSVRVTTSEPAYRTTPTTANN